jgi:cobalamin synthase
MGYYVAKIAVSAALIALISEIAKRSALAGAVLASVPLVSVLALIWLYADTRDTAQVAELSRSIVWLVLPSLVLFVVLPILLERRVGFYASLATSLGAMIAAYLVAIGVSRYFTRS